MKISSAARRLLFEFISIVFAVLLALFLNQCKDDQKNRRLAQQSEKMIIAEFKQNVGNLRGIITANKERLKGLKKWEEAYKKDTNTTIKERFGFNHTLLSDNTWQSAILYQAMPHMRKDFVNRANATYNLQHFYVEYAQRFFSALGTELYADDTKKLIRVRANIHQLGVSIGMAETLMKLYQNLLKQEGVSIKENKQTKATKKN